VTGVHKQEINAIPIKKGFGPFEDCGAVRIAAKQVDVLLPHGKRAIDGDSPAGIATSKFATGKIDTD
jgi:hypothetical protein